MLQEWLLPKLHNLKWMIVGMLLPLATISISFGAYTNFIAARIVDSSYAGNTTPVLIVDENGTPTGTILLDQTEFPVTPVAGQLVVIIDDSAAGACDSNSGAAVTICRWNGASWEAVSGGGAGNVATDTIWDAAGDLVQGTGSNTAARLALGTAGQVLTVNAGATAAEWGSAGAGDVTASSAFGTDNRIIKSDGTGKGVQSTGVTIADTTNAISGADFVAFGADPGDAGRVRLSNDEYFCWEAATPGTDLCFGVNSSGEFTLNAPLNLTGTAGAMLLTGVTSPLAPGSAEQWYFYADSVDNLPKYIYNGESEQTFYTTANLPAASVSFTNKTIDCTTAGNVCTVYKYLSLPLVGVSAGTTGHIWNDDPLSTTCTAASTAGTNQTRAFCTFPDSDGEFGKQLVLPLPTGYVAGTLQFRVTWKTTGTGNLRPRLQTLCYASDASADSAYSNSTYITAAAGTSARWNKTAWTTATDTGCDAEEDLAIRFSRNRTEASDTLTSTADVEQVEIRYAMAQ